MLHPDDGYQFCANTITLLHNGPSNKKKERKSWSKTSPHLKSAHTPATRTRIVAGGGRERPHRPLVRQTIGIKEAHTQRV